jgi:hypothetical protein
MSKRVQQTTTPKQVNRLVRELVAALKGRTDLEIREVYWDLGFRLPYSDDGTIEAAKREMRARRRQP